MQAREQDGMVPVRSSSEEEAVAVRLFVPMQTAVEDRVERSGPTTEKDESLIQGRVSYGPPQCHSANGFEPDNSHTIAVTGWQNKPHLASVT
jgi:hypothetical protein